MIDIIETQKLWGKEFCFRIAKRFNGRDNFSFWDFITIVKAKPVAVKCDVCGEIEIVPHLKWRKSYDVCKKCFGVKHSATMQGIALKDWAGFVSNSPYCKKFNEKCKERNRGKFFNRCFICNKPESDNNQKLSVHHVDMNKEQGCNSRTWKLVPLCKSCHGSTHNPVWQARIEYILREIYEKEQKCQ